jgi:hypothetical protein
MQGTAAVEWILRTSSTRPLHVELLHGDVFGSVVIRRAISDPYSPCFVWNILASCNGCTADSTFNMHSNAALSIRYNSGVGSIEYEWEGLRTSAAKYEWLQISMKPYCFRYMLSINMWFIPNWVAFHLTNSPLIAFLIIAFNWPWLCNQAEICLHVEIVPACFGLSPISFNIKLTVCARQGVQVMCSNSRPSVFSCSWTRCS